MKLLYAIRKKGIGNKKRIFLYNSFHFKHHLNFITDIEEIYNEDVRTPEIRTPDIEL